MTQPMPGIRQRFIGAALISIGEDNARATSVDKSANTPATRCLDKVLRASNIHRVIKIARSPEPHDSRHMINNIDILGRGADDIDITNVADNYFSAVEEGVTATRSACFCGRLDRCEPAQSHAPE
jgi:hypothetical protein